MALHQDSTFFLFTDLAGSIRLWVQEPGAVYEEGAHGRGRYRLLETVWQDGRDRLRESGVGEAVRDRHLAFCLALAEEAEPELWRDAAWCDRLKTEHDNLRAALDWCQEAISRQPSAVGSGTDSRWLTADSPAEIGLRLAGALRWF